jgi:hypothetical protein
MGLVGLLQHWEEGAGIFIDAAPTDVEGFVPFSAAVDEHAAAPAYAGIVEEKMDLVRRMLFGDLLAKSLYLRAVRDIGKMGG